MIRARPLIVQLILTLLVPVAVDAQLRTETIISGLSQPLALVPDPAVPSVLYVVGERGFRVNAVTGRLAALATRPSREGQRAAIMPRCELRLAPTMLASR